MKTNVLLDTSVIIDFLRKKDKNETYLYKLAKNETCLFISIITHTELYAGKSVWNNPRAKSELETIFEGLTLIPLNENISKTAGEIKAKYDEHLIDAIISATAKINKISLFTLNEKHFSKVSGISLYKATKLKNK